MQMTVYRNGLEPEIIPIATTDYRKLHPLLKELLGDEPEHVTVLHEGRRADMFVGEMSSFNDHNPNPEATAIYHAASKAHGKDMRGAPLIYGPAVLFDVIVWA